MTEPTPNMADDQALDQIASFLGLYTKDPGDNPVEELISDIVGIVQQTGRPTNTPQGG